MIPALDKPSKIRVILTYAPSVLKGVVYALLLPLVRPVRREDKELRFQLGFSIVIWNVL